jgi:hypothetical protein
MGLTPMKTGMPDPGGLHGKGDLRPLTIGYKARGMGRRVRGRMHHCTTTEPAALHATFLEDGVENTAGTGVEAARWPTTCLP